MALTETLNKRIDPLAPVGRVAAGGDVAGRADIALGELEPAMRAESQSREALGLEEARARREQAQAVTQAEQEFAGGKRRAFQEYETGLPERPMFNPTQFDEVEAGKLAGLTAVVGTLAGRNSARAALRSMANFTKGAKEGRAELYDKEVKQFERDIQAWKDNLGVAKEKLNQVIDLLGTNKNAALVKAKELDPLLQDGLVLAKVRQQDYKGAVEVINNAIKAGDQLDLALAKSTSKGGLKPSATERDRYSMQYELLTLGNQIQQKLKDPKLAALMDQPKIRFALFLQEENKALDQLLQPKIPKEIRDVAILIKKYRNSVYRAESGLAVTAYEAMRQYGANPQPGSTSQTLLDQIEVLNDVARRSTRKLETIYPDLSEVGVALRSYEGLEREGRDAGARRPQIATAADVAATATANNITEEEAKKRLRAKGIKIEGEE